MPVRPRFDAKRPLIVARDFTFAGRAYTVGDRFPHPDEAPVADRLRARQYEARVVNMGEAPPADPVQMTPGPKNGYYTITAPWFDEPKVARGKVNAEKALEKIKADGPPLGWIAGGSEVTVTDLGDGKFAVQAPWMDEAEEIEGREAAEARQREIHQAGAPAPAADEGGEDEGDDSHQGDDDNSDKSESEPGASDDAGDGSGTDAPDGAGDAQTAGEAAGNAEAGKSKADAPADA